MQALAQHISRHLYLFVFVALLAAGSAAMALYLWRYPTSGQITGGDTQVIVRQLDTPWSLDFLPDGSMLVTERAGRLRYISPEFVLADEPIAELEQVVETGEGGLLGLAVHPDFAHNSFIYLYYTYQNSGMNTLNRVSRFRLSEDRQLTDEQVLIDAIPGATIHNGGRVKFGPDGLLYITTGDAADPSLSQDQQSLAGKILRITDDGQPAAGNPFGTMVYSLGHRNPQGLAWDDQGRLWATEHGQSATDEINLVTAGGNYGWPQIRGEQQRDGFISPVYQSGQHTWAPSGAAWVGNQLWFAGLRGEAVFVAQIADSNISSIDRRYHRQFGRIRDVEVGPDGAIYLLTNNRDGRGLPGPDGDRIIRVQL